MNTLERKNIMIAKDKWEALKMLSKTNNNDISISNLISLAIDKFIKEETNNNLAFKLWIIAKGRYVSEKEEEDIIQELKNMSPDELEPVEKLDI